MPAVNQGSGKAPLDWCKFLNAVPLRKVLAGAVASCSLFHSTLLAQQSDVAPMIAGGMHPPEIQSLQLEDASVSGQVDAKLSPNVDKLLKPQFHLEIERRHSQLVVTKKRVRRIAVTDSTIANYVQFSESEISLVGLELGKTDLSNRTPAPCTLSSGRK